MTDGVAVNGTWGGALPWNESNETDYIWLPPATAKPLNSIFWLHIPKTSTAFASTVLVHACGLAAVGNGSFKTGDELPMIMGDCSGGRSYFHSFYPTRVYNKTDVPRVYVSCAT
jgi:hypothetical protein